MSKLHVLTLISVLLLAVVVGCSSSDQSAIDEAVSATLVAAQPATTNSTELSECVTVIAYFLASEHNHRYSREPGNPFFNRWGRLDYGLPVTELSDITHTKNSATPLLDEYCGTYIDSQLLEHFISEDWYDPEAHADAIPEQRGPVFIGENKD